MLEFLQNHIENALNVFRPNYAEKTLKNAAIKGSLGFVFKENSSMEITRLS